MNGYFSRWIQIAKKIISKSRKDPDISKSQTAGPQTQYKPNTISRPSGYLPHQRGLNRATLPPGHCSGLVLHNNRDLHNQAWNQHTTARLPVSRTFNGSENDLSLNCYSQGREQYEGEGTYSPQTSRVRYSPDGRSSPEVRMYKTRVIYHSRQDCVEDREASV